MWTHGSLAIALAAASAGLAGLAGCTVAGDAGTATPAIANAASAADYPEGVLVGAFCSGTLVAPRVALTAGHCQALATNVTAPANGETSSVTSSQTFYSGDAATSHDVAILFLETPIELAQYPTIASAPAAPGTSVVEIGRTDDGQITSSLWQTTDAVSILDSGSALGFPYNYQAQPDVSEDGDSGGAVMIAGTHELVALVDTDTIEQGISEPEPIDLFASVDQLHDAIGSAIDSTVPSGGGCAVAPRSPGAAWDGALVLCALAGLRRRSRPRGRRDPAK